MGYLNEDGLARYDGLIKNWVTFKSGTVDGIDPLLNWQKTDTAASVACYPLPVAPIDPVVNFMFTESGPASGTKGPDNPSTITGVESVKVTRCGKNLLPSVAEGTTSSHGITFVVASDGSVSVSGTADANAQLSIPYVELKPGTYFLSGCPSGGSQSGFYIGASGGRYDTGSGKSFTLTSATRIYFWVQVVSGTAISTPIVFKPQLELGSTATSFDPYDGADYTVNLGNTYYGGSVNLSAGTMTVTHVMVEPDSLAFDVSAHPADAANFQYADTFGRTVTTDGNTLTITGETGGQIVYNLATPETVSLTPTQIYSLSQLDPYTPRLNTVYSDQTSVQVGYPKSPQATAAELTNAIISLGSNL